MKFKPMVRRFVADQGASMSIVAALSAVPLILAGGAAVDLERVLNARTALRASLDSAALYAASLNDTSDSSLTTKAKNYVTTNYSATSDGAVANFAIVSNASTVTASGQVVVPTVFMGIVGTNSITVGATSTVLKQGFNLEVALVLDNTNSMNSINAKTGYTAIHDAIAAANLFVQMVPPQNSGQTYTKIAAIPYNNSVNMGTSALAQSARGAILSGTSATPGYQNYTFATNSLITGNRANTYWGVMCNNSGASSTCQRTFPITNCVTERTGAQAYTDTSLAANPVGRAYFINSGPLPNTCAVAPMVPLSVTAAPLTTAINSMVANYSTAGQVGIAWGWYALSPNVGMWSGTSAPASYSVTVGSPSYASTTPNINQVHKVMILMTDGDYNVGYCNGVISGSDPVMGTSSLDGSTVGTAEPPDHIGCAPTNGDTYTQSTAMCKAIKASGIEVYVVTFQLNTTISRNVALTQNCATDAAHVIDADAVSPSAAFAKIANQLNAMRIQS